MSSTLLGITTIGYLLCMALYFCCIFFKSEKFARIVTVLVMIVAVIHTAGFILLFGLLIAVTLFGDLPRLLRQ